jgi:hypothetical protein
MERMWHSPDLSGGVLRSDVLDPAKLKRVSSGVERCVNLQLKLVEDLLDVTRITAGTLRLQDKWVDLAPVVAAALELVRAPASEVAANRDGCRRRDPALPRRSHGPPAGRREPARQLRQAHPGGWSREVEGRPPGRKRAHHGDRHGLRDRPRVPAARLRTLRAGGRLPHSRSRGARARPRDRAPHRGAPRRDDPAGEPGEGPRRDVHPRAESRGQQVVRDGDGDVVPCQQAPEQTDVRIAARRSSPSSRQVSPRAYGCK